MSENTADGPQETEPVKETALEKLQGEDLVRPTLKFLIAIAALFVAQQIVLMVPAATDTTIGVPNATESISVAEILVGVFALLMVAAIINYASSIGTILRDAMEEFTGVRKFVLIVGVLASLLLMYQMFRWVIDYYPPIANEYDLAFLVAGLVLGGWLVIILLFNVDKLFE